MKKHLDELIINKRQLKILEKVAHGSNDNSRDGIDFSPIKKARRSCEEDIFMLPSTSNADLQETL